MAAQRSEARHYAMSESVCLSICPSVCHTRESNCSTALDRWCLSLITHSLAVNLPYSGWRNLASRNYRHPYIIMVQKVFRYLKQTYIYRASQQKSKLFAQTTTMPPV